MFGKYRSPRYVEHSCAWPSRTSSGFSHLHGLSANLDAEFRVLAPATISSHLLVGSQLQVEIAILLEK